MAQNTAGRLQGYDFTVQSPPESFHGPVWCVPHLLIVCIIVVLFKPFFLMVRAMVTLTKCPCVGSLRATISLSRREKCLGLPLDDGLPIT